MLKRKHIYRWRKCWIFETVYYLWFKENVLECDRIVIVFRILGKGAPFRNFENFSVLILKDQKYCNAPPCEIFHELRVLGQNPPAQFVFNTLSPRFSPWFLLFLCWPFLERERKRCFSWLSKFSNAFPQSSFNLSVNIFFKFSFLNLKFSHL